jgi:hypothetical protein
MIKNIIIKGTTESEIESKVGASFFEEINDTTYILPISELVELEFNKSHTPEYYSVISRGDGYVDNMTVLETIDNPKIIKKLTTHYYTKISKQ